MDAVEAKECFKCGVLKPPTDFYRHGAMRDRRLNKCKECTKADVAANYRKRREYYAQYERERFQRPERKKACIQYQRKRRAKNPAKYKAHYLVGNAIRDGRLVRQPCRVCGDPKAQAHHHDYSKPLDVEWLCRKHHLEAHGKVAYE